jgi:hypothetical protein
MKEEKREKSVLLGMSKSTPGVKRKPFDSEFMTAGKRSYRCL